jgi:diguanylate cyclase (GGDEF)-like protein
MTADVELDAATPPVVRLTLAMLDAPDVDALADVCARQVLELFGAVAVRVLDEVRVWAESAVASDPTGSVVMIRMRISDGEALPVDLEVTLPRGPDLPIVRQQLLDLVAVARRAWRDRRRLSEERRRAREDVLTGLDNRRGIEDELERAVFEARHSGTSLTVMLIDLDGFKEVNDTDGHPAGDDVLRLAASCFRRHLRPTDRVSRWGGDEFMLLLPGLPAGRAVPVADRLRRAFADDARARGTTMSIGIADLDALDPSSRVAPQLVALADQCLYEAKRAGRNRIVQAAAIEQATG